MELSKLLILLKLGMILSCYGNELNRNIIFSCTLDQDLCAGTVEGDARHLRDAPSKEGLAYKITDVTSITQPTINGQQCQIPFNIAGNEYYHCYQESLVYKCATGSNGQLDSCKIGQYINLRVTNSISLDGNYTSDKIAIPQDADKLRLSFYYLFECFGSSCQDPDDRIVIYVNEIEIGVLNYGNAKVERRWFQHSFDFTTQDPEIQFKARLVHSRPPLNTKTMIAIDHFELITIDDDDVQSLSTTNELTEETSIVSETSTTETTSDSTILSTISTPHQVSTLTSTEYSTFVITEESTVQSTPDKETSVSSTTPTRQTTTTSTKTTTRQIASPSPTTTTPIQSSSTTRRVITTNNPISNGTGFKLSLNTSLFTVAIAFNLLIFIKYFE